MIGQNFKMSIGKTIWTANNLDLNIMYDTSTDSRTIGDAAGIKQNKQINYQKIKIK